MPKIVDHDQRRAEICDAVLGLIARGGSRTVTTRSVAKATGWSAGTVSHYFDSRDELVLGALRRAAELHEQELGRLLADRGLAPMEKLHLAVRATLPIDERGVALTRVFLDYYADAANCAAVHAEVMRCLVRWRGLIERLVEGCKDDGSIVSSRDSATLAVELVALTDGFALHALLDRAFMDRLVENDGIRIGFLDDTWHPIESGVGRVS